MSQILPHSSKKYAPLQLFTIKQSYRLRYFLIAIHALAAIASVANDLTLIYQLIALLAVIISAVFYGREYVRFQTFFIQYSETLGWQLANRKNDYHAIHILPSTVLTASFITLHFKLKSRKKKSVFILRDAMTNEGFKALLVTLKISALSKEAR